MNEIRKKIYEDRKLKTAEIKKGNTIPKIIKFTSYLSTNHFQTNKFSNNSYEEISRAIKT